MAQNMAQLTDMWMVNPTMFDPTQASNQFSNYNNAALPWPPTYNPGLAGGPVNAATGKPIQSFQQWQQQNPGGMSINSTPAMPAAAPAGGPSPGTTGAGAPAQWGAMYPGGPMIVQNLSQPNTPTINEGGILPSGQNYGTSSPTYIPSTLNQPAQTSSQAAPQAAQQAGGPPNNWQAAINALANPGNPQTMGATVPMVTGSQPAGGVNNAFLQQAGAGQGMNTNFLNALRSIQARPQQ